MVPAEDMETGMPPCGEHGDHFPGDFPLVINMQKTLCRTGVVMLLQSEGQDSAGIKVVFPNMPPGGRHPGMGFGRLAVKQGQEFAVRVIRQG
jgi:hypothetical protein